MTTSVPNSPTIDVPLITIRLDENKITLTVEYVDRYAAAKEHRGWLRSWKTGALKRLIERSTWA